MQSRMGPDSQRSCGLRPGHEKKNRPSSRPQPNLLPLQRAQPQGVELDEARGATMIVGDRTFLEGDEILIVQRILLSRPTTMTLPSFIRARAVQLLSLSSLGMCKPSPADSRPVFA